MLDLIKPAQSILIPDLKPQFHQRNGHPSTRAINVIANCVLGVYWLIRRSIQQLTFYRILIKIRYHMQITTVS